jgi:hypothetical protein
LISLVEMVFTAEDTELRRGKCCQMASVFIFSLRIFAFFSSALKSTLSFTLLILKTGIHPQRSSGKPIESEKFQMIEQANLLAFRM